MIYVWIRTSNCIWLPRQDQLQEMIKQPPINKDWVDNPRACELIELLVDFVDKKRENQVLTHLEDSMEQLWLAFVMHELYSLEWNGKEWVSEKAIS